MNILIFLVKGLLWLFCFISAMLVLFFLYSLNYFLEKFFDDLVLNGIKGLIIAFALKILFMKLFGKVYKKKLESFKKESKRLGEGILKLKKVHIISLIVDTCLVSILFLLTLASRIDLSLISELMVNIGIEKNEAILAVSGVLVLTLILQYKTTLSDSKCEPDGYSKSSDENSKELRIREINDELIKLFNGGEKK